MAEALQRGGWWLFDAADRACTAVAVMIGCGVELTPATVSNAITRSM